MDKKFKFQKILEYRERLLDIEKKKLVELQNREKDYKFKREALNKEIENNRSELEKIKNEGKFQFINMYENYDEKQQRMFSTITEMLNKVKLDIEKQRKKIFDALNDVKIMEKLKEKHYKNYLAYLKKEELKLLDDLTIMRKQEEDHE